MLPNFLVVGAQKSGTTSLHHYLQAHPEIFLPELKETKFFVHEKYYCNGIEWYQDRYFSGRESQRAVGEVDPDILYCAAAIPRIVHELDVASLKLIFVFRNPVERAFSHYLMSFRRGQEPLTFEQAIDAEQERTALGHMENLRYSYVARGYYMRQIARFLDVSDRSNMLFLLAEDLQSRPSACMKEVYKFLGVNSEFSPSNLGEHFHRATVPRSLTLLRRIEQQGPEKRLLRILIPAKSVRDSLREWLLRHNQTGARDLALSTVTRERLMQIYRAENAKLSRFLGRDLRHWDVNPSAPQLR